jgi:TP901 family phage tail tape measure protein
MAIKPVEILIKARDEASGVFDFLKQKAGAVAAALVGYFSIATFAGAVKGAAELEAKLSEVKAVSNATAEEMVELRKAAEDAGATTKFTATEGAEALGNLTRAGLSAKDAIAALPAVLSLAQAGGIGLGEASDYVTKAVQGMGLQFSDAGRVADVLAMGANASNASVTGLAQALSYAAPVAQSLGLSLETTVAIIGKFSDAGIDASRAGTALNAILSQFSDPASKFRQELAASGIITNNFEDALRQLAAAGPAGEKAVLAVGTEAGPALRALLNQGIGALDDLKGKLQESAGSAAAAAAVMEDNLPGAFNSLASAWDTVKNTLATPVLPVLKDGVTQLAESLRGAVSNGTIGKFGDALSTAFQSGLKWAREFLGTVDFAALTVKLQDWADRAGETFDKVGEYATNAGNIVQTAYGVMSAGVNTVKGVIYSLAEAFAGVASNIQSGLAMLLTGLSKITFGGISASFKAAAEEVRLSAGATWAVSEAFAKKAAESFDAAAEGADIARRGFEGLAGSAAAADRQAATSTKVMQGLANTLKDVGDKAVEAGQKAQAGAAAQREAAEQARAAVVELRKEYEAALAAGNVQVAAEKLQTLRKALNDTTGAAKSTKEQVLEVEQAFTRLGVTSTAELKKQRDAAERDYKIIRDSGLASAQDLRSAWQVYAEKAIAANGGVATETLKSEAAMRGLRIEVDEAGRATVVSMNNAARSTGDAGRAAKDAADHYANLAKAARSAAAAASGFDASGMSSFAAGVKKTPGLTGGPVDFSLPFSLYAKQKAGALTADDLAAAKVALETARSNARLGNPGSVSLEGRQDDQVWIGRLQSIVDQLEALQPNDVAITPKTAPAPSPSPAPAPAAAAPTPVVINLPGGTSTRINVAGQADAQALQNLLAQLTAAASVTKP